MNRQEGYKEIRDYLDKCVMAAKMYGDDEMRLRCGRALFAFEADIGIEIFTGEAIDKHFEVEEK